MPQIRACNGLLKQKDEKRRATRKLRIRQWDTYRGCPAGLGDSRLVQFVRRLVEVLGGFFGALFVLLEVGDCDVGLLRRVEGEER